MNKRNEILKKSIEKYIKDANASKLIDENQIENIINAEMRKYEKSEEAYQHAKNDYKEGKKACTKLIVSTLVPLIITTTMSLTTMGVCYACKDKIGPSYDEYYKVNKTSTVEYIDNENYELETVTYPGRIYEVSQEGYRLYAEVPSKKGKDISAVYSISIPSDEDGKIYFDSLKNKSDIAAAMEIELKSYSIDFYIPTQHEKPYYKVLKFSGVEKETVTSKEKKEGYKISKKNKINIAAVITESIGLLASGLVLLRKYDNDDTLIFKGTSDRKKKYKEAKVKKKSLFK